MTIMNLLDEMESDMKELHTVLYKELKTAFEHITEIYKEYDELKDHKG
jgi:hypothetical protein